MTKAQWDELITHAREDAPNECCGYLQAADGAVEEVFRAENTMHSPYGFALGFDALLAANDLEDAGFQVGTYHSHPRSEAKPSQMDINVAQYPTWLYLIVSLVPEQGEVRGWWIVDGKVSEEEIVVDG
jgi:proteasome lid subunit RPN8/RPN11